MGKQIKPRYTNKEAEKYSDDNIKIFLGTIKYFDKLAFNRPCIYKLEFYRGKLYSYKFDNLFNAMRFLLAHKDSFIEYGFIELRIVYTDDVDDFDFSTLHNESNVLRAKYNFEKYSKSCIVVFSKDLDQVYMVNLCSDSDFSGYEFSYDMKFLYENGFV